MLSGIIIIFFFVQWLVRNERKKNKFYPFTEPFLRPPGYTLKKQLEDAESEMISIVMLIVLPPVFSFFLPNKNLFASHYGFYFGLLIMLIYGVYRLKSFYAKVQPIKLGYFGELYTGQELNYLMLKGAHVYHDIPYRYGNIDHIIVCRAGVFTIETKAIRKHLSQEGKKQARVSIHNGALKFPHFTTQKPINQAKLHAKAIKEILFVKDIPIIPVVALPGWYIEGNNMVDGTLIINPARGKFLEWHIAKERINEKDLDIITQQIEEMARNINHHKSMIDGDAGKHYDIMLNRKN